MGFIKRMLGTTKAAAGDPPDGVRYSVGPTNGDPEAKAMVDRLAEGKWGDLPAFLEAQRDVHRRDFFLGVISSVFKGRPKQIVSWPTLRPDSGLGYLARGMQGLDWAWDGRGGARASATSEEQFRLFFERLNIAKDDLIKAAQMMPADALPWIEMLPLAMGLQVSIAERFAIFDRIRERDPWHPGAHKAMVGALTAKWGGSDEEMFAFARNVVPHAPEGSTAWVALALCHYEVYLDRGTLEYFADPAVREEIYEAAAHSIDLRRGDPDPFVRSARATFAMLYWLMDDLERLRPELIELDRTVCGLWLIYERPALQFHQARIDAGLVSVPESAKG